MTKKSFVAVFFCFLLLFPILSDARICNYVNYGTWIGVLDHCYSPSWKISIGSILDIFSIGGSYSVSSNYCVYRGDGITSFGTQEFDRDVVDRC